METDLKMKIALRDSTVATRPYVLVNPLLAKHLPSVPSITLEYFSRLGSKAAATCKGERVLVVGFAETATAVGAVVASAIENAVYVHTTREPASLQPVAEFFEEHSHAKNQAVYLREGFSELSAYDRIVFVEDEITTGKTILNFLQSVGYSGKITVSALVFNGFDKSAFARYTADFVCLQEVGYVHQLEFGELPNPRSGVEISVYCGSCLKLAEQIVSAIDKSDVQDKDILVIGTEEFMYPALALGRELEKNARSVKSQSTTRSPLLPQSREGYPFHLRCSFASLYDHERTTYLYNLEKYDTVIIITDARLHQNSKSEEIIRALQNCGNQKIYFIKAHNAD